MLNDMPRAKVKDADRQRAAQACTFCKNSKTRCDSKRPCARCVKQGRASACEYTKSVVSTRKHDQYRHDTENHALEQSEAVQNDSPHPTSTDSGEPRANRDKRYIDNERRTTHSPETTQSRMLLSSKGERVFVGEIASLSFLQFLRRFVRHHLGRSSFTEPPTKHIMLETEINDDALKQLPDEDLSRKLLLAHCYLEATSGIFDLYTKEEIYSLLGHGTSSASADSNDRTWKDDAAALSLVIAIGAQCRSNTERDMQSAARNFDIGQKGAFEGLLLAPSITMIRLFLLMSFYKLGACQRNGAFMYLGVAGKAACAIGLHRWDQSKRFSAEERSLRLRLWKSLCILDSIVNSVLGRPHSLPDAEFLESSDQDSHNAEVTDLRKLAFHASYCACSHLGLILKKVSNCNRVDTSLAEHFLEQLRSWSQGLSPGLRQFNSGSNDISNVPSKEILIGNAHVACIYYFTVTLITRPFLISHLLSKLHTRRPGITASRNTPEEVRVSNLAHVCLEAAISMTRISKSVLDSGGFFGNMCLLKALIFAAGLLLGFSLFANNDSNLTTLSDTEAAFHNARDVLLFFSQQSPQARLYYEILSDFSDAISKYRQHLVQKRKQMTNQYIDQSFTVAGSMADQAQNNDDWSVRSRRGSGYQHGSWQYNTPISNPNLGINEAYSAIGEGNSLFSAYDSNIGSYDSMSLGSDEILHFGDPTNLPFLWDDFGIDWQDYNNGNLG